jgi:hypothetical protein
LYPFKKETVAAGCGCSAPKAFSSKEILCCFVSSPSGSQNFSRHCHFEYQLRILLSTRHYGFHRNEDVFRCSGGPQPSLTAQQSKKRIGILGFQNLKYNSVKFPGLQPETYLISKNEKVVNVEMPPIPVASSDWG